MSDKLRCIVCEKPDPKKKDAICRTCETIAKAKWPELNTDNLDKK